MKMLLRLDEEDIDFLLALIARNERDHEVRGLQKMLMVKQALQEALKLKEWNKVASSE
jgi:hypothetical protein